MIPTWQGYRESSYPDRVFLGFPVMPGDHYQYASLMRQAQEDASLLMKNEFTTEPQRGTFILLYYWVIGRVSHWTGASLITLWEAFRLMGGFLYIIMFWVFTQRFFQQRGRRVFATVLFGFAGGLDWILELLRVSSPPGVSMGLPYDYFWNWCTFGTMLVATWVWPALMMLAACHIMLSRSRLRDAALFVLLPVVWLTHHHSAMVAYLMFGLAPLMPLVVAAARLERLPWARARELFRLVLPALLSLVLAAAYVFWARGDTVFKLTAEATFAWTPFYSVWWYPLAYGILFPLAYFGIRDVAKEGSNAGHLLLAWLSAAFFLSVNPLAGGVKYQYLLFPPMVILAARGLYLLIDKVEAFKRTAKPGPIAAGFLILLFVNAPLSLFKGVAPSSFLPASEIEAMKWLHGQPEGIVLSSPGSGNILPWLSGKKVYAGHWFMTLNLNKKTREVAYFFAPQAPLSTKREILRQSQARYVYYGGYETALGEVDTGLPLRKGYEKDGVSIYEVVPIR